MAMLFMDSFDHYATADVSMKYTSTAGSPFGDALAIGNYGRRSSQGMRFGGSSTTYRSKQAAKTLAPTGATTIVGFALKCSGSIANLRVGTDGWLDAGFNTNRLLGIRYAGTDQWWARIETNGKISVMRSSTLLGTTTNALTLDQWAYVEFKVLLSTTVGTVTVKINGTSELTLTGQNTQNAASALWDEVILGGVSSVSGTNYWDVDDFYVCDGNGSRNTDFLGDRAIVAYYPSGASVTQWDASAGSNYQCVDDAQFSSTDYVSTSVVNEEDCYAMQDTSVGATINAAQVLIAAANGGVGAGSIAPEIWYLGSPYTGTTVAQASTSYTYVRQVYETNPGTSTDWSETSWNNSQVGMIKIA